MNKVKKFIKNNKLEMQVLVYGIVMLTAGFYIGGKIENKKWSQALNYMAKYGSTMSNVVDGKEYVCSVTEIIK